MCGSLGGTAGVMDGKELGLTRHTRKASTNKVWIFKTHEHTSKVYTRETQFWTPLWKERCMGKPKRSLATSHTNTQAKIYTNTQDMKVWVPLWKERCMGKPETLLCYKTLEHTSKVYTRETQFRMPLWKERCTGKLERSLATRRMNTQAML